MYKWICVVIVLVSQYSAAQYVSAGFNAGSGAGVSISANVGGTAVGQLDGGGDADFATAIPFVLPVASPSFDGNIHIYWDSPSSMTWGGGVYTDGGNKPDGGTKVCSAVTTSSPTNDVYTTLALTGCPATLTGSAGTVYWLVGYTHNNTVQYGKSMTNDHCPGTALTGVFSSSSHDYTAGLPSTLPAFESPVTDTTGCLGMYITLSYTSSSAYNFVAVNSGGCDTSSATCTLNIAPTISASDALWVFASAGPTSGTISSVSDSASDTFTSRGCGTVSTTQWCAYSTNRVSAGANTVSCTHTNSGGSYKDVCVSVEIQGPVASSSFDKSEFDSAYITAQSFTSGATATLSQNKELLLGFDGDFAGKIQGSVLAMTASGSWNVLWSGATAGNSPNPMAIFWQIVNTTPTTYTLTGAYPADGSSNNHIPGLVTIR